MEYSLLAVLWVVWCFLHSVFVSNFVIGYLKEKMGAGFRFFRLIYCLFSVATLMPLLIYTNTLKSPPFFFWNGYLSIIKYLLLITAVLLFIVGGRRYDFLRLLGIRQIIEGRTPNIPQPNSGLEVAGILGVTRHPWYLAGIIAVWAGDLSSAVVIINVIISGYFIIGAYLEELKLIKEFGEEYREYQRNVSMLFPLKWLKTTLS